MAGILDILNGQGGDGAQNGLLEFLRGNALNQQPAPGGLQSDVANYGQPSPFGLAPMPQQAMQPAPVQPQANPQPSPLDNAAWPAGPFGAPSNANAAMPAPQPPAAPLSMAGPRPASPAAQPAAPQPAPAEPSSPGLGDRLSMGAKGFLGNLQNGGILGGLVGGVGSLVSGRPSDPQTIQAQHVNLTVQALKKMGVDPAMADAAASNPEVMKVLVTNALSDKKTSDVKNFEYAQAHPDFKTAQEKDAKYGLSPMYGVDANGQPVAIQLSDKGGASPVKLPNGVTLSKTPIKVDTATGTVLIDPVTRLPVATIAKDISGAAAAKETGKAQGQAANALPQVQAASDQILKTIGDLETHPGMKWSLGAYSKLPNIPGTEQANFRAALDQLKGETFLQAYNTLKGGGAITDIEGKKGTDALARLNTEQTPEAFKKALSDFRGVIQAGVLRASAKAHGPAAAAAGPQPGYGNAGDAALSAAKDAIAQGAPRDAVVERLRQSGVDPGDL